MRRRTGLALLLMVTVALAVGCSSAKRESANSGGATAGAPGARPAESPAPQAGSVKVYDQDGAKVANAVSDSRPATPNAPPLPGPGPNAAVPEAGVARKEIKNANFELKVKNVDEADKALRAALQAAGGFIQTSQVEGQKESGRRMTISLRVPAAGYDSTFTAISNLGEEITRKEWTQDVTQEYYDLEARIKVQEVHSAQLKKLYEKAGSIPEMIQLEQELARVQGELDSLKGRYQYLSNQVSFSTITVYLFEPNAPTPIKPAKTVWGRMSQGFVGSWNGLVNFGGDLLVFLVSAVPVAIPLGIVGGAGFLGYRTYRRRKGGSPAAPTNPTGSGDGN